MKCLMVFEVDVEDQEELEDLHDELFFKNEDIDAGGYTSKESTIEKIYKIFKDTLGESE